MKFYDLTSYNLSSLENRESRFRSSLWQLLRRRRYDILGVTLPLLAFLAWLLSLRSIHLNAMNDLGLVSVFNPLTLFSLALLSVSFCLLLLQRPMREPLLLLHVLLLILMLYAVTALLEAQPRFNIVYRHAGFTDYIMRHGSVDPDLDAYFNWPGFFILSAFITRIAGYQDILPYAAWSPVAFNLLYLSPLFMILNTSTTDKRVVWLALWFFFMTNWIGQDYYSPQGLNFFMYLVIIAILLTGFRLPANLQPPPITTLDGKGLKSFLHRCYNWLRTPDAQAPPLPLPQRIALLICLLVVFAFIDFSHPLTPFFVLTSVWALVLFRRCTPLWLPIVLTLMTIAWIVFMAQAYLIGHFANAFGSGGLSSSITSNLTQHVIGNAEHTFVAQIRIIMTVLVWGFALLGGIRRLRAGYHDVTYVLLAVAPFPLLVAQSYGGEMLLRIYLFSLPMMAFFAASLFFIAPQQDRSLLMTLLRIALCLLLLAGFLFTRYGNESMDYMTNAEVSGTRHLYAIAPFHSILIAGWSGAPWQFTNIEEYDAYTFADDLPDAVMLNSPSLVLNFIHSTEQQDPIPRPVYLLFTRSERQTVDATTDLPPGGLNRLEHSLLATGQFQLISQNQDTHILLYTPKIQKGQ